jgi:hypothetical protein
MRWKGVSRQVRVSFKLKHSAKLQESVGVHGGPTRREGLLCSLAGNISVDDDGRLNRSRSISPERLWDRCLLPAKLLFFKHFTCLIARKFFFFTIASFFLFGLRGYWHCGHSWPIVPASGDSEDDYGEADGM